MELSLSNVSMEKILEIGEAEDEKAENDAKSEKNRESSGNKVKDTRDWKRERSEKIKKIRDLERQRCPLSKLYHILILLGVLVIVSLLQGGKGGESMLGVKKCSSVYWGSLIVFLVVGVVCIVMSIVRVRKDQQYKELIKYKFHSSDIIYKQSMIIKISSFAFLGGAMAGSLGIGKQIFALASYFFNRRWYYF